MEFYKSTEKVPEEEKEGDYFLIKYSEPHDETYLAIVTHKNNIEHAVPGYTNHPKGLILKYINYRHCWDSLITYLVRDGHKGCVYWHKLTETEMMAYL